MPESEPAHSCSPSLTELVDRAHSVAPAELLSVVRDAAAALGVTRADVWLVDWQQELLTALELPVDPLPPRRVPVQGSSLGLAFIRSEPTTAPTPDGQVLRLPLLDGIERLGVLELELPGPPTDQRIMDCRRFVEVLTQYVATKGRVTDQFHRVRTCQPMSLAAQLQWQLLLPVTAHAPRVMVAGQVEPAYEVGGDAFDYALAHDRAHVAIFDAMGHGVQAGLTTALAVGAYRNNRRRDDGLVATLAAADELVAREFGDGRFVTAMLGELELAPGTMQLLNAGHLQPLLLRRHQIIDIPDVTPGLPLGLGGLIHPAQERITELQLQPGDRLVLVTDGILDAVNAKGQRFGEQRLADTTAQAAMDPCRSPSWPGPSPAASTNSRTASSVTTRPLLIIEYTDPALAVVPPGSAPRNQP